METKTIENEFAYLIVSPREEELLQTLFEIAKKPDDVKGKDKPWNPQVQPVFEDLMRTLFPHLSPHMDTNGYTISAAPYESSNKTEVSVAVNAQVTRSRPDVGQITIHRNPWRATVETYTYDIGVIDDLVSKLGKYEDPVIVPFHISLRHRGGAWRYNPQVIRYDLVRQVYASARELLDRSEEIARISEGDLHVLRRDGRKHDNIFVREGSQREYDTRLEQLARFKKEL